MRRATQARRPKSRLTLPEIAAAGACGWRVIKPADGRLTLPEIAAAGAPLMMKDVSINPHRLTLPEIAAAGALLGHSNTRSTDRLTLPEIAAAGALGIVLRGEKVLHPPHAS